MQGGQAMRCGRRGCRTPIDRVRQVKAVTLCAAHRAQVAEIMSAHRAATPAKIPGVVPPIKAEGEK